MRRKPNNAIAFADINARLNNGWECALVAQRGDLIGLQLCGKHDVDADLGRHYIYAPTLELAIEAAVTRAGPTAVRARGSWMAGRQSSDMAASSVYPSPCVSSVMAKPRITLYQDNKLRSIESSASRRSGIRATARMDRSTVTDACRQSPTLFDVREAA